MQFLEIPFASSIKSGRICFDCNRRKYTKAYLIDKGGFKLEVSYINISEAQVGNIIADDIYANTQYPIVCKDTKVTKEHIDVFHAFSIEKVPIYLEVEAIQQLGLGTEIIGNFNESDNELSVSFIPFKKKYKEAVIQFEKEFIKWESGASLDISKIRSIILPLVENILENRSLIFDLNSFSDPQKYLYHHCIATGLISSALASKLGFDRGYALQIAIAGALADSGMAKIPRRIRDKREALNELEFAEIRKHPIYSYNIIKDAPALKKEMKVAIYQHHERLDGSGYVEGKRLGNISIFSQIIAVADTFHAMTSERIYRSKESSFKVIEMIKESEFGKFEIRVVSSLINIVADLPIGTKVELSNLEHGEIMFVNKYAPTRPLVKLHNTNEIIDLSKNRKFYISRVITEKN